MEVFSINPNTGEYFKDRADYVSFNDSFYHGTYNHTPIYPRYTFETTPRSNYSRLSNEIEFYTMLPIKRFWRNYLVEVRFKANINPYEVGSLNTIIDKFNKTCKMYTSSIDVKKLI